jgi:gluconate 2-dehydrogenase gamma chain
MDALNRRQALQLLGTAPALAALTWTEAEAQQAHDHSQQARAAAAAAGTDYEPKFFSAHELATITLLVNAIIPADDRSGNASDAGVPEFIDFMMVDQPERQVLIRGGLKWLDVECLKRFDTPYASCSEAQRTAVLDDIAWPAKARPEHSHGARFFSAVRDLTATGFFTSRIGIEDLQYKGNTFVPVWDGVPQEALDHLGVSYDKVAKWYQEG